MATFIRREYKINEGNIIGYMPTEFGANQAIVEKKIVAGKDVLKGQVVEVTGEFEVQPTSAASDKVLGVAFTDAKAGEPVSVETEGLFKLQAGGSIQAGDLLESAGDGCVAKVGGTAKKVIGVALNGASTNENVYVKFTV